jgi:ATP-dependent RNA helicase DDX35
MHSQFNNGTLIKYMTDGTLIKEMLQDPLLSKYSVLMIDDVHERSINTDIILGLLKKIQRKRPDLKLVISSATLDARPLAFFFEDLDHGLKSEVYAI